jgi:hypothetical protein
MSEIMMNNGKLAGKADYEASDVVKQMIDEAKAAGEKGKVGLVTKESVIQSLKIEDVPEAIKTELKKDIPTKDTVLQALTVEDVGKLPEAVKQKVCEDAKIAPAVPEVIQSFVKQTIQAAKGDGKGTVTEPEGGKKSLLQQMDAERRVYNV